MTVSARKPKSLWAVFWLLLLCVGTLLLMIERSIRPPAFSELTAYACKASPVFGQTVGQKAPYYFSCDSGTEAIRVRTWVPVAGRYAEWRACGQLSGIFTVWLASNRHLYGRYIFQSACGGKIFSGYEAQSAIFEETHAMARFFAWKDSVISFSGITMWSGKWIRFRALGQQRPGESS
jgi:hypothetical protein